MGSSVCVVVMVATYPGASASDSARWTPHRADAPWVRSGHARLGDGVHARPAHPRQPGAGGGDRRRRRGRSAVRARRRRAGHRARSTEPARLPAGVAGRPRRLAARARRRARRAPGLVGRRGARRRSGHRRAHHPPRRGPLVVRPPPTRPPDVARGGGRHRGARPPGHHRRAARRRGAEDLGLALDDRGRRPAAVRPSTSTRSSPPSTGPGWPTAGARSSPRRRRSSLPDDLAVGSIPSLGDAHRRRALARRHPRRRDRGHRTAEGVVVGVAARLRRQPRRPRRRPHLAHLRRPPPRLPLAARGGHPAPDAGRRRTVRPPALLARLLPPDPRRPARRGPRRLPLARRSLERRRRRAAGVEGRPHRLPDRRRRACASSGARGSCTTGPAWSSRRSS